MDHRLIEDLILAEPSELSTNQLGLRQEHLATCVSCQQKLLAWQAVQSQFKSSPVAAPKPGFTLRWQQSLAQRKEAQMRRQIRNLLVGLAAALVATLASLGVLFFFTDTTDRLFIEFIRTLTYASAAWGQIKPGLSFLIGYLPSILPVEMWVGISLVFAVLCLVWVVSIWRITSKGVTTK
jgi:hypothetical protein